MERVAVNAEQSHQRQTFAQFVFNRSKANKKQQRKDINIQVLKLYIKKHNGHQKDH